MSKIKEAWDNEKICYQSRYYRNWKKVTESQNYGGTDHGAMLEMSFVLHEVFGLTDKEIEQVERNRGLTDSDC